MPRPPRSDRHRLLRMVLAVGSVLALGCSSSDAPERADATTSTAAPTTSTPSDSVPAPDLSVTGPVSGTPTTSSTAGLDDAGYVEEEFFVSGAARSFAPSGDLTDDGRWEVEPLDEAQFTTRILVKRPADPADASGVVVVEWNNVSSGFDSTPDWTFTAAEVLRSGHIHVGVSAQKQGVDGEGGGLLNGVGGSLVTVNPERYGDLSHPGDEFSYDMFGQIGALVAAGPQDGPDPLDGFLRDHVIAMGESQSAFRLTSYINGLHQLDPVFDGFLVHSRGGGHAGFGPGGDLISPTIGETHIREDLDEPVLIFTTETDLTLLGYRNARQPDTDRIRSWEIAGTAHADAFLLGGDPVAAAALLGCDTPINDGPQHLALKAALASLTEWIVDDVAPSAGEPIELTPDERIARDEDGNALGGIRLPPVVLPTATISGDPGSGGAFCSLFGTTTPFPPAELVARYGSLDEYLDQFADAYDASVTAGFALEGDRTGALAEAGEASFGPSG